MPSNIIGPSRKKKVAPSEKVTPSEEVEKVTKTLDEFEGQCSRSVVRICITFSSSIQYQRVGLILIVSG